MILFSILFTLGFALGIFAFAQIWYPITHSAPRLIYYKLRKEIRMSWSRILLLEILIPPAIWGGLIFGSIKLCAWYLEERYVGYFWGVMAGFLWCFIFAKRNDIQDDFNSNYSRFFLFKEESES